MKTEDPIRMYANWMQLQVHLIDPNKVVVEAGRGTGKTEGVTGPRTVRVASSMPGETGGFGHSTYIRLMSIIIPELISYYTTPRGPNKQPLLREGIDFVYGVKDLPKHFLKPRYPILHPEHSIVYANGFNIRLVSTDQPDSIAGANIVHFFFEEMKHSKGDNVRSRIFPAMRVGRLNAAATHKSPYYGGFTGVSDTARLALGEDPWFVKYADKTDQDLINDIASLALHVNKARAEIAAGKDIERNSRVVKRFSPLLDDLRRECTLYLRVSSFVNKDVLGAKFFTDQFENLSMGEFLTSICSIHEQDTENMFFERFDRDKHTYTDSYLYQNVMTKSLRDTFSIDASYLKYYNPTKRLLVGFDPGSFASVVVAQQDGGNLRILKEFFIYSPEDLPDLADKLCSFFSCAKNRNIDLYYDRAGNQHNARRAYDTDANILRNEFTRYGFKTQLKTIGGATIFHWQHYLLWKRLLANTEKNVPRILIDANECPNLVPAIFSCRKIPGSAPVELDKTPEKKVPLSQQAAITPQIPSALMYLVFGLYSKFLPKKYGGFGGTLAQNRG